MENLKCFFPPCEGDEPFIFFSYCHADEKIDYTIIDRLCVDGYRVWYDDGIHPGSDWPEVIAERLEKSAVCIAAVSASSAESANCKNEMTYAIASQKPVIPVILENFSMARGLRMQVNSREYIKFYEYSADMEGFFSRLEKMDCLAACKGKSVNPTAKDLSDWRARAAKYSAFIKEEEHISIPGPIIEDFNKKTGEADAEAARIEAEHREAERRAEEARRVEAARIEAERREAERRAEEARKAEAERREAERREAERRAEEARRVEAARIEAARRAAEEARRLENAEEERLFDVIRTDERELYLQETTYVQDETEPDESDEDEHTVIADNDASDDMESEDGTVIVPREKKALAYIIRKNGAQVFRVTEEETAIGRSSEMADICIEDHTGRISKHHADLICRDGRYILRDNGSTNKTYYAGKTLGDMLVSLREIDSFRLDKEEFIFIGRKYLNRFEEAKERGFLAFLTALETGEMKMLDEGTLLLDRHHKDEWQDGVLSSTKVSRERMCAVLFSAGEYSFMNILRQEKKNRCFLNGMELRAGDSRRLTDGDVLEVAETDRFKFTKINLN